MPKESTQFKTTGLGTTNKQQPISVKFPPCVDAILRDESIISDRSVYIRNAVLRQLQADGLISDRPVGTLPSLVNHVSNSSIAPSTPSLNE